MDHVEGSVAFQRVHERAMLPHDTRGPAEVHDGGAAQAVGAGLLVVAQHVNRHAMSPCEPPDQGQQRGDNVRVAAAIETAGRDKGDAHQAG